MRLEFTKMHGLGNDFVVIDAISQNVMLRAEQIRRMGDRHTGIGFDQLLIVEPPSRPTQNSAIGSSPRRQRGGALRQWCSLLCVIRPAKAADPIQSHQSRDHEWPAGA